MARFIRDKIWLTSAKILATFIVAFFFYGLSDQMNKMTLRIQKTKKGVDVEVAHKPHVDARWIYISGNSEVFTSGSLIQSEGDNCAVIHRLSWRIPHVGILEVRVDIRDQQGKILETAFKTIVLGHPVEGD